MSSSQSSSEMKIKIIIAFLYLGILSAAEEEKKNLAAVVGGNITLSGTLIERGILSRGFNTIAEVENRSLKIFEDSYRNKLHWNQTSGLFTITDLQRSDSGVYTIDSKEGRGFLSSSNVTVYDPVETPAVNRLNVSSDSCWLECLVDKRTTLLWYKDEEVVEQSSSAFSLNLSVHKQDVSSSFRCVASSPAEETSLPVNVITSCWTDTENHEGNSTIRTNIIVIPIIILLVLIVLLVILVYCVRENYFDVKTRTTTQTRADLEKQTEVQYSVIQTSSSSSSQGENFPETTGTADCSIFPSSSSSSSTCSYVSFLVQEHPQH